MLGIKSNIRAILMVLASGVAVLLALVCLSPAPDQARTASEGQNPNQVATPITDNVNTQATLDDKADPFKEQLSNQQAGNLAKVHSEKPSPVVPKGTDPFKEKLIQQSRQSSASPFGN